MSQNNEGKTEPKPEVDVKTALPPNPLTPEELAKDQEKEKPPKQDVETKHTEVNTETQKPPSKAVEKSANGVKLIQLIIVISIVIAFSFGLILLYDPQLRSMAKEKLLKFKERFKKQ